MIKAVIFDLDNTLMDFMSTKKASCDAAIDAMIKAGLKTPKNRASKILFSLYWKKGIEHQTIFQIFLKKILGKIDYKIMAAGIIAYRRTKNSILKTYPNVKNVLGKLHRNYKLAILSDAPALQAWTRLVEMGLEDFFDVVVTYDDTKKHKPHPKPFMAVLKKLGVKNSEVIMIGDNVMRDVKGANRLGIKSVLASYGNVNPQKPDIKPGAEIDDINELPAVIKKFQKNAY
ncbi:MAG: TIGR02253 family HAD-type hydrolase [Candidatus Aenigmarchaeota archaeon]|nr:TIGR02253 family HAD-type hydrolase [Candidatus Aenigmarchaeota archaeon]